MRVERVTTAKGVEGDVQVRGEGDPVVYLHGAAGLLADEPMLDRLAAERTVYAPVWPGYGDDETETFVEDMLDFALHGWDVVDALGLDRPALVGHSMGGMIAAEMACVARRDLTSLVLVDAFGLWDDDHVVPDLFAMTPFEIPPALFADADEGVRILTAGLDFDDDAALTDFMVRNARQLGTAGKIMFPIPNRRVAKRLYRLTAPTLVLWGSDDALLVPAYAEAWGRAVPHATVQVVEGAGHMLPVERPDAAADAILEFWSDNPGV